ncbi:MAG: hypothetical protein KGD57_01990 [Candidatus Lokiarchaeota archaeon]|nr:hypothetical protein [Candidatus Lokiarchaeota archaeon]
MSKIEKNKNIIKKNNVIVEKNNAIVEKNNAIIKENNEKSITDVLRIKDSIDIDKLDDMMIQQDINAKRDLFIDGNIDNVSPLEKSTAKAIESLVYDIENNKILNKSIIKAFALCSNDIFLKDILETYINFTKFEKSNTKQNSIFGHNILKALDLLNKETTANRSIIDKMLGRNKTEF